MKAIPGDMPGVLPLCFLIAAQTHGTGDLTKNSIYFLIKC